MSETKELKARAILPCPFCGYRSEVQAYIDNRNGYNNYWWVECSSCEGNSGHYDSELRACEKWNTRVVAEAEALKAKLAAYEAMMQAITQIEFSAELLGKEDGHTFGIYRELFGNFVISKDGQEFGNFTTPLEAYAALTAGG